MMRTILFLIILRECCCTVLSHLNLENSSVDRLTDSLFGHFKLHEFETEAQFPPCPKNTTVACEKTQTCVMIERRLCDGPTCTMTPMGTCVVQLTESLELPTPAPLSVPESTAKTPTRHRVVKRIAKIAIVAKLRLRKNTFRNFRNFRNL